MGEQTMVPFSLISHLYENTYEEKKTETSQYTTKIHLRNIIMKHLVEIDRHNTEHNIETNAFTEVIESLRPQSW